MNKDFSHTAFIALGSNMNSKFGSPLQTIKAAILQMQQNRKYAEFIKVVKISSFINSKPQNCVADAADFANGVIKIATIFENPFDLLKLLQSIEIDFGRTQNQHKSESENLYPSRILDLDILLFDDLQLQTPELTIPHPRMQQRDFVMIPLQEIL